MKDGRIFFLLKWEEEGKWGVGKVKDGLDDSLEDFFFDCFCFYYKVGEEVFNGELGEKEGY